MPDLLTDIETHVEMRKNLIGDEVRTITDKAMTDIALKNSQTVRCVCTGCLKKGIIPLRYLRNSPAITIEEQIVLAESQVAVVGCGGLGGHVILLLTRLGIGKLHVFDPDTIDETNLNRQVLCFPENMGAFKAEEAARQCAMINPAVEISAHVMPITRNNQGHYFSNTDVVVDALDNPEDRLLLNSLTRGLNIPMVHGAVAGFEGRVMTVSPGDTGIEALYHSREGEIQKPSAETLLGTPALAPSLIATFQAMAVLKILLKRSPMPVNSFLHLDLENLSMNTFIL
jgi:molybdopterin/thiamine biosynthesis adenylyltransferase